MNAVEHASIRTLPGKVTWAGDGYVYVLAFSNGTLKVGSTTNPLVRVSTHRATAVCFGIALTNCWLTPEFRSYLRGEQALLGAVAAMADTQVAREWFSGVNYHDVITIAPELTYSNRGAQTQHRKAAAVQRCLRQGEDPHLRLSFAKAASLTGWADIRDEFPAGQQDMALWQLDALIARYTVPAAVPL